MTLHSYPLYVPGVLKGDTSFLVHQVFIYINFYPLCHPYKAQGKFEPLIATSTTVNSKQRDTSQHIRSLFNCSLFNCSAPVLFCSAIRAVHWAKLSHKSVFTVFLLATVSSRQQTFSNDIFRFLKRPEPRTPRGESQSGAGKTNSTGNSHEKSSVSYVGRVAGGRTLLLGCWRVCGSIHNRGTRQPCCFT